MTPAEQLKEQVAQLESQLLSAHPMIPALLRTIHTQIKSDPELVTVLSEEDISIIVKGLSRQTNTEIASTALKTKSKSLKNVGVADL